MSDASIASSYDTVPFEAFSIPQTHPDLMGTIAHLFGIESPARAEQARVLELGAGKGSNLIPYAVAWPESDFLGIDLSIRQVEMAQHQIEKLGLKNIQFRHASILDFDDDYGQFDYIICHGVYSWVPDNVQDAILRVCKNHLKPNGIAYVSYNTMPGWHMRGMIREMMVYHDQWHKQTGHDDRVKQARALLYFLREATKTQETPYSMLLGQELESLRSLPDSYIFHEHLEEHNVPVYFHQFNDRVEKHKLRFLGEADFRSMVHHQLPPAVGQQLKQMIRGLIEMQQYLDFVLNRTFRQSLLCHDHHTPVYGVEPRRTYPLHVFSPLQPEGGSIDPRPGVAQNFVTPRGASLASHDALVKAALGCLAEAAPKGLAFEDLTRRARKQLDGGSESNAPTEADRAHLGGNLLHMYTVGGTELVEFWRTFPRFASQVSERPVASPLVRLMASQGINVTNLRQQTLTIGEFDRFLIELLDGTNTLGSLATKLVEKVRKGDMTWERVIGQPIRDEIQARPALIERLQRQLSRYAESALLVE